MLPTFGYDMFHQWRKDLSGRALPRAFQVICSKSKVGWVRSVGLIFLSNPVVVLCLDYILDVGRVSIAVFFRYLRGSDGSFPYLFCVWAGLSEILYLFCCFQFIACILN